MGQRFGVSFTEQASVFAAAFGAVVVALSLAYNSEQQLRAALARDYNHARLEDKMDQALAQLSQLTAQLGQVTAQQRSDGAAISTVTAQQGQVTAQQRSDGAAMR